MKWKPILILSAALFAVFAWGQTDSVIHVKTFPGITVGDKVAAAMKTCQAAPVPCILTIDASLAAAPSGTMPTLCANCYLYDFRTGPPSGINGENVTPKSVNAVVKADQFAGSTADAKLDAACASLPAGGGTIDARGFGPGVQQIASTVSCGSGTQPVTILFDPATIFQPASSALNMFSVSDDNAISGLHIDSANQPTYSGSAIVNSAEGISQLQLSDIDVSEALGAPGHCMTWNASSASSYVEFAEVRNFTCHGGTGAAGILLENSNAGWINSNHFFGLKIYDSQYGIEMDQAGTGDISANQFFGYEFEADSLTTALAGVHIVSAGAGHAGRNQFYFDSWDLNGGQGAVIAGASTACGNLFFGTIDGWTDGGTSCVVANQADDLFGSIGTTFQLGGETITGNLSIQYPAHIRIDNNSCVIWKNTSGAAECVLDLGTDNNVYITGDGTGKHVYVQGDGTNVDFYTTGGGAAGTLNVNNTLNAVKGYSFNGTAGFTGTKTAGTCVLTIQGGIITNVTGC